MDQKDESGEEMIDEAGRNATQQRMDAEGVEDRPVAVEDADRRALRAAAAQPPPAPEPPPEPSGLGSRLRRLWPGGRG